MIVYIKCMCVGGVMWELWAVGLKVTSYFLGTSPPSSSTDLLICVKGPDCVPQGQNHIGLPSWSWRAARKTDVEGGITRAAAFTLMNLDIQMNWLWLETVRMLSCLNIKTCFLLFPSTCKVSDIWKIKDMHEKIHPADCLWPSKLLLTGIQDGKFYLQQWFIWECVLFWRKSWVNQKDSRHVFC